MAQNQRHVPESVPDECTLVRHTRGRNAVASSSYSLLRPLLPVQRLWFPEELSEYTGADDKPILIAILG